MRSLGNRVSALALAVVMASSMATVFSVPVAASDGFTPPSNAQICAYLAKLEADIPRLPGWLQPLAQKLVDAAEARYGCN